MGSVERTVLVVDDEPTVRDVVVRYLERAGYRALAAADGDEALTAITETPPDLVVLDVMLPGIDGFDLLTRLRRSGEVPVIMLTARAAEPDRVQGLVLGADDYVVKPFSPRELVARVHTVLRRASPGPAPRLEFDDLVIDGATREVFVDGEPVELAPKEFDLLHFLAASPREVFSRARILEAVWDSSAAYQDPSTVTVHMRRLRQKLEADPDDPRRLVTVWGVGYRFEP